MHQRKSTVFIVLLHALYCITGCSTSPQMDYRQIGLVDVSGTITLDGTPLAGAVVTFESTDTGNFSFGQTNASGEYKLQFDSHASGCTPGVKKIEISTVRKIAGLNSEEDAGTSGETEAELAQRPRSRQGASQQDSGEKVPACYNRQTKLSAVVTSESETLNFNLRTDCTTTGPAS